MSSKIKLKKYKHNYDKRPSRVIMYNKLLVRIVLIFLLVLVGQELELNNQIVEFILYVILIPSIITILLVTIVATIAESLGGEFMKKYVILFKIKKIKFSISIFTICMYILVFSIYLYLYFK
ncbi:MAG: hypothetical protein LAT82_05590 [Nanoarchaeota archaeon]|nr:hypothetical protein [Nanoarchaeota archaeon]